MYVTSRPQDEPSPTAARTLSAVCPTTMPTSVIPASAIARRAWNRIGVLAIGMSCFALVCVMGRRRDPSPPERTSAFIGSAARRTAGSGLRRRGHGIPRVVRRHEHRGLVALQGSRRGLHLGDVPQVVLDHVSRGLPLLV